MQKQFFITYIYQKINITWAFKIVKQINLRTAINFFDWTYISIYSDINSSIGMELSSWSVSVYVELKASYRVDYGKLFISAHA
jgi:hypothetical protein